MIKVNYDTDGNILGFYPDDIEYKTIPTPYIEIDNATYKEVVKNQDKYIVSNGAIVVRPDWTEKELQQAKANKYAENDTKSETARTSKTFTLTLQSQSCEFDTKAQTQTDLLTAFAVCSQGGTYDGWVCNNGVVIDLTLSDVTTISVKFKELSNVYPHWNYYKSLIDNATTKAEVDAIVIDYDVELTTDETVEETENAEATDEDN